jgi:hypothetical protein
MGAWMGRLRFSAAAIEIQPSSGVGIAIRYTLLVLLPVLPRLWQPWRLFLRGR